MGFAGMSATTAFVLHLMDRCLGISGLLSLHLPTGELKLEAKVAYSEGGQVGLIFLFKSPWERGVTVECIAQVANHTGDSQVVPFP
jgi:hypothetical protein